MLSLPAAGVERPGVRLPGLSCIKARGRHGSLRHAWAFRPAARCAGVLRTVPAGPNPHRGGIGLPTTRWTRGGTCRTAMAHVADTPLALAESRPGLKAERPALVGS